MDESTKWSSSRFSVRSTFLVYINDLDTRLTNEVLKFADDTEVFGKVTDGSDRESIQEDLN